MKAILSIALLLAATSVARAEIKTRTVTYKQGKTTLEGYLAWDDAVTTPRPAVLVVHEWMGITDVTKKKTEDLAKLGYVAFAADIYGKGVRPATPEAAGKEAGKYKNDRKLLRARVTAAFDWLEGQKSVDKTRIAAIGFCFGGTTVLELARSGAPVAGVVSFHGGLDTPAPEDAKNIKGKVLVLHGGDDPFVPNEHIVAFQKEMRDAGVDWQMVSYGGAVHSFTNPKAGTDNSKGAAYNEKADRRSWKDMQEFFSELFATASPN